jgi:hypothetical protein
MGSHFESTEIARRHVAPALEAINAVRDTARFPNPFALRRKS